MKKYVLSNNIYTPQEYLEKITGFCYVINEGSATEIQNKLKQNLYDNLWDYPLNEIDEVLYNQNTVVLVDCTHTVETADSYETETEFRWFEVPEELINKFN